jgi:hypothetical protein
MSIPRHAPSDPGHNRAVPPKDDGAADRAPTAQSRDMDIAIAASFSHAMAAAEVAHEAARMAAEILGDLARLVEERAGAHADGDGHALDGAPLMLPADVSEVASLGAAAAGVEVEDYLRAAVLAYSATDGNGPSPGDDPSATSKAARREARRLIAESRAVQAQTAHVVARINSRDGASRDGASADGRQPKS